jgi:hypothetical protein
MYTLNSTKAYHVDQLDTLGWELTVCNALHPAGTPLRKILTRDDSFGHLLYDYLSKYMPMEKITRVIEIGGGYGYLMKDLLERNGAIRPVMLDVSPFLLQKQKETLREYNVYYAEEDFLETDPVFLTGFELAVLNENLGDFPVLVDLDRDLFQPSSGIADPLLRLALHFFEKYDLERPEGVFNLNIGALQALEKLCTAGIPYIYMGEHSCEASAPETLRPFIHIESTGNPERIALKGHDEYTIKFSYLENIARAFNYRTIRGSFADFIPFHLTDELRYTLLDQDSTSDETEMVSQFIDDLFRYEYMVIIRC